MRQLPWLLIAVLLVPPGHAEAPPFYADKSKLLVLLDAGGKERPIRSAEDWAKRRAHILANMQVVMGPMPDASRKVPLDVKVDDETKTAKFIRRKLTFAVEKDDRVPAYLFIPTGLDDGVAPVAPAAEFPGSVSRPTYPTRHHTAFR